MSKITQIGQNRQSIDGFSLAANKIMYKSRFTFDPLTPRKFFTASGTCSAICAQAAQLLAACALCLCTSPARQLPATSNRSIANAADGGLFWFCHFSAGRAHRDTLPCTNRTYAASGVNPAPVRTMNFTLKRKRRSESSPPKGISPGIPLYYTLRLNAKSQCPTLQVMRPSRRWPNRRKTPRTISTSWPRPSSQFVPRISLIFLHLHNKYFKCCAAQKKTPKQLRRRPKRVQRVA